MHTGGPRRDQGGSRRILHLCLMACGGSIPGEQAGSGGWSGRAPWRARPDGERLGVVVVGTWSWTARLAIEQTAT
ncbi:hypothetical protein CKO25_03445 [Thiocapsa imhoffii]|uniref:Uncharacterized protein n=1 Tax=Thiocapsa imhoffii TaxID=382777 RepID=A0A9X1B857_9GAMM|nr:hypothetical protein [Thiocapsa imhoffii]